MSAPSIAQQWAQAVGVNEQSWLELAYDRLRADLFAGTPPRHATTHHKGVVLSYGFPKGRGRAGAAAGATYHGALVDGRTVIMIHPREWTDAVTVLAKLGHQMLHARWPGSRSHKGSFAYDAHYYGYREPLADALPGDRLTVELERIAERLPPFPASSFDPTRIRKSPTRNELYECQCVPPVKVRHAGRRLNARCEECQSLFMRPNPIDV